MIRYESLDHVLSNLGKAFNRGGGSPPPTIVNLDTLEYDEERRRLAEAFAGKHWWKMDSKVLYKYRQAIPLFEGLALRYYMPSFIVASLEAKNEDSEDMRSWVLMSLNPVSSSGCVIDSVIKEFDLFTSDQKAVISDFVQLFLQYPGLLGESARTSFGAYWKQYRRR